MYDNLTYSKSTGVNWLIYQEGHGMFCLLCRKHGTSNSQKKGRSTALNQLLGLNEKQLKIKQILDNMQLLLQQSFSAELRPLKKK